MAGLRSGEQLVQVFTQFDYSDIRSFLRTIQSYRQMVPPTTDFIVNISALVYPLSILQYIILVVIPSQDKRKQIKEIKLGYRFTFFPLF